jgi:hypothetical protein
MNFASALIKIVIVTLIWLPYKLSSVGRNAPFMLDLVVAAVAFGIAYALIALVGLNKKQESSALRGRNASEGAERF